MRKTVCICLILAYINTFLACSTKVTKQLELSDISSNDKEIAVVLEDFTKYYFKSDTYQFKADSLEGIALTEHGQSLGIKTISVTKILQIKEVEKKLDLEKVAFVFFVTFIAVAAGGIAILGSGNSGGF